MMIKSRRTKVLCAMFGLALISAAQASADEKALPMWHVEGANNEIYLLGSIHLLREKDYPLPEAIKLAYEDAETLIMELDMDDIDPIATQAMTNELGLIQNGGTLADMLGPQVFEEAQDLAESADIPLELLNRAEPWFAAMNVEMMLLMRMGFNPALGVESHVMQWAQSDQKEIRGFETMRQQLEFLDGLSPEAQQEMFMQALADGPEMLDMMDEMIVAWRTGDTQYLEDEMLSEMQGYPELNQTIVVNRNVNWTQEIEKLLNEEDDYLIVVGTLHLVGDDGVPGLLSQRGHTVTQMQETDLLD